MLWNVDKSVTVDPGTSRSWLRDQADIPPFPPIIPD